MNPDLTKLIVRLKDSIAQKAPFVSSIRYPQLLVASLQELNTDVIGNDKVKKSVADQIAHLIMMKQRAIEHPSIKEDDVMLNTVLYGPPGTAKTTLGIKLAKIWYSLGYLESSTKSSVKKQELGSIIKDVLGNNSSSSGGTDDTALAIYLIFMFIVIFITVLSMAWSFYSRFGGISTLIVFGLIIVIILMVAYYLSSSFDSPSSTNKTKSNKSENKNNNNSPSSVGIKSTTDSNQFGNSPVVNDLPSDDQVIKIVTRTDFVDKYVGWSDKKALKLLEDNLGKVLFVDEAYSLVTDMHDTFGIEILTTINLFLSQHPNEIILIFAGYKDLMENGIFSFQPGLKRRFMWQFDCSGYTEDQLFDIFKMQLRKKGWGLTDESSSRELFRQHPNSFPSFGGDTERLAFLAKLEHSHDFIDNSKGMIINKLKPDHIRRAFLKLNENNISDGSNPETQNPLANMMAMLKNKNSDKSLIDNMLSAASSSSRSFH